MRIVGNPPSGGKKPGTPTIGTATAGDASATVAYTAPTYVGKGGTVTYRALSTPGSLTGTGASPITVSGLTNGTSYTFQVRAETAYGVNGDYSSASASVTPVTPTAFESIASTTASGSVNSITFSSIPGTYQYLQLRIMTLSSDESSFLRINSDTGSNYIRHGLYGNGTSVSAFGNTAQTSIGINNVSSAESTTYPAVAIIDLHDYASTSKTKTIRIFSGIDKNGSGAVNLFSGLWNSTSAVTSLTVTTTSVGGNYSNTSVFALYGIKG